MQTPCLSARCQAGLLANPLRSTARTPVIRLPQAGSCSHRHSLHADQRSAPRCARDVSAGVVAAPTSVPPSVEQRWWEKRTDNMRDVHSVQDLVDALADAGDQLVIVDFYAQWCNACRALYPKLCKLMVEHPNVVFLKVDFDANRELCKPLGIKVLPFFHMYRGAEGKVASFSCTVTKLQRFRDALDMYDSPVCSLMPNPGLEEFPDVVPHVSCSGSSTGGEAVALLAAQQGSPFPEAAAGANASNIVPARM